MPVSTVIGDSIQARVAKIGTWDGDGTYSDILDLYGVTNITTSLRLASARREGDGQLLAVFSSVVGGTISIEMANNQLAVFAKILGQTYSSSGSTGEQVGRLPIYNKSIPYMGLTFGIDDDEGTENAFHGFAPKMKITSDSLDIVQAVGNETPEFGTTTIEFELVKDDNFNIGASNEVQNLDLGGASGGTYTLSFGTETTSALGYDATAVEIDAALEALANIGTDNVAVTADSDFVITFGGTLAQSKLPLIVLDATNLTGNSGEELTRTTAGSRGNDLIIDLWEDEQGTEPLLPPALSV